jgi:hypothetical protein
MGLSGGLSGFDPAQLNDALALRVDWSPLKRGGASFCTHRLVKTDLQRCEFKPTAGALFFALGFALMGLLVPGIIVFSSLRQEQAGLGAVPLFPLLIGAAFVWIGGYMFRTFATPVVFDLRSGWFWKGRLAPIEVINHADIRCAAKLEEIHALQLVSERCTGKNSTYRSYELNLVLKSGERLNIFDHGNMRRAREDAEQLACFLGRPVWDAIEQ